MLDNQYEKLRSEIEDLVEFAGLSQAEIATTMGWPTSSISRFLNGHTETVPYSQGKALEDLYAQHEDVIKQNKISRAQALLASVGADHGKA